MQYNDKELEEGVYKIRQFRKHCFMKVIRQNGRLHYSIDGGAVAPIENLQKQFPHPVEIIKKLTAFDPVVNVRVIVQWQDLDHDKYEVESSDTKRLRKIFDDYPQLLRQLKFPH